MLATYTPAIDDKLRQWAAEGVPVIQQAARLGVSRHRVAGWRRRLGLTSLADAPVAPEIHTKIMAWIEDGWPLSEIAETSGLSLRMVRLKYPEAAWTAEQQGSLGITKVRAARRAPELMKGL